MIDCSDRKRLLETGNEFIELLSDEKLSDVPILIFANKQDLVNLIKVSEIAEAIGLIKLKDRTWQIQECSAIQGTGIKVTNMLIQMAFHNVIRFFSCFVDRTVWTGSARILKTINRI